MARIEDFVELENTPCLLDDGSFVIIRNFDFVDGTVRFDDHGESRALSFARFRRRVDPSDEELSSLLIQIEEKPSKKPVSIITLRPTATDERRKAAFGKNVFLLPYSPKQDAIYRIKENHYRLDYCEAIGDKRLASFKPIYIPTVRLAFGDEALYRDCLSLLCQNAQYVKTTINGKESIVNARFALSYFWPRLKEFVDLRKKACDGSRPLTPHRPSKATLSLLDSYNCLPKPSEEALNRLAPLSLKELNRRSKEYVYRGEDLFFSGHVLSLSYQEEDRIRGLVLSSNESDVYETSCSWNEKGKITHSCNCPYGEGHSYCKHSLALLIALCHRAGVWPNPMEEELKNMAAFLYGVDFSEPMDEDYEDDEEYEEYENHRRYW